jgi:DNA-binding MarR family transcriptional regulator
MSGRRAHASSLESHLGFWLRFVSNHVSARFKRVVEANGVSVSEWVALRLLYDSDELTPAALIEELGMTKGAISKILARLEDKELIRRLTVEHDRRAQRLVLTPAGRKLVPKLAKLADDNDEAFFGGLSEHERAELMKTMIDLVRAHGLREVPVD